MLVSCALLPFGRYHWPGRSSMRPAFSACSVADHIVRAFGAHRACVSMWDVIHAVSTVKSHGLVAHHQQAFPLPLKSHTANLQTHDPGSRGWETEQTILQLSKRMISRAEAGSPEELCANFAILRAEGKPGQCRPAQCKSHGPESKSCQQNCCVHEDPMFFPREAMYHLLLMAAVGAHRYRCS